MANNNALFDAVIAGCAAVKAAWGTSTDPNSYAAYGNACAAFATAVDARIAPTSVVQQQADLLQSITAATLDGRNTDTVLETDQWTGAALKLTEWDAERIAQVTESQLVEIT